MCLLGVLFAPVKSIATIFDATDHGKRAPSAADFAGSKRFRGSFGLAPDATCSMGLSKKIHIFEYVGAHFFLGPELAKC